MNNSSNPKRKSIVPLLLFLGLALIVLTACGIDSGALSLEVISSPTPELAATPTRIWFPVTSTPELIAVPTGTPSPNASPVFGALVFDDTGIVSENWIGSQEFTGIIATGKDSVSLVVNSPRGAIQVLRKDTNLSDMYFESVMSVGLCKSTDLVGVIFRAADPSSFYLFAVNCQGKIALERVLKGSPSMVSDWSLTNQVQKGLAQPLKIGIWARGSTIRIYLNDQLQYEVVNTAYYNGGIGFFAQASGDTSISANFSEIKVYQPVE